MFRSLQRRRRLAIILGWLMTGASGPRLWAQSTAFTYQGQLKNNGSLAEGQHDFRFRLFDAASGGTQVGTTQCADNILVKDGVFTATMDFGNQFATPNQRFIEILVRRDTGLGCADAGGFSTLSPRQPISPTPMATHAKTAFTLAAADGSPANAVFVDNSGWVGIGTTTPGAPIHIASPFAVLNLQDTGTNANQAGYVSYRNGTGTETAWVGFGTAGDPDFSIVNARPSGDIVLNPFGGNVRLGAGQFFATGGEQNLRILRGAIIADGSVLTGSGFTAQRIGQGGYRISWTTPFANDQPTVVATALQGNPIPAFALVVSSVNTCTVTMYDARGGGTVDAGFNFVVIGTR